MLLVYDRILLFAVYSCIFPFADWPVGSQLGFAIFPMGLYTARIRVLRTCCSTSRFRRLPIGLPLDFAVRRLVYRQIFCLPTVLPPDFPFAEWSTTGFCRCCRKVYVGVLAVGLLPDFYRLVFRRICRLTIGLPPDLCRRISLFDYWFTAELSPNGLPPDSAVWLMVY